MKKLVVTWCVVLIGLALVGATQAQLIVDPSHVVGQGKIEVGGVGSKSTVEYKDGDDTDVDRMLAGGYAAYGITDMIDAYGFAAYIFKNEPDVEGWDDEGTGYLIGGGARAQLFAQDMFRVMAYGQLQYVSEDYGKTQGVTLEATVKELAFGGVGSYSVNEQLTVYGGLELVPWSDGEVEYGGYYRGSDDVKRSNMFGIRGGATFNLGQFWLRGEVGFVDETTFSIGAGVTIE